MKIAWIYPFEPKLGNSLYGASYARALRRLVEIEEIDVAECLKDSAGVFERINACDTAHIQYEINFFNQAGTNGYDRICRRIHRPMAASLHELYRRMPNVFPREEIAGPWPVKKLKQIIYDLRHPACTLVRRHRDCRFHADRVVVHYPYQKAILVEQGIPARLVEIITHPVVPLELPGAEEVSAKEPLNLGATGFINLNYDYDQLIDALALLKRPWRFTWAGGLRREEDKSLLESIQNKVAARGWKDRFEITGWISEEELIRHLASFQVVLALFSARSTSGTLAKAIAARSAIVARRMELTLDLNAERPIMLLTGESAEEAANQIARAAEDAPLRRRLMANIDLYVTDHTYDKMARQVVAMHEGLLRG